ncbi:hypothetical protein [Vibrio fortis]|nr:hypothetical protein [Vibrio fortis]
MLGLLGTVDGMMECFEQLNNDDVLNAVLMVSAKPC